VVVVVGGAVFVGEVVEFAVVAGAAVVEESVLVVAGSSNPRLQATVTNSSDNPKRRIR
jgi:hypothetical protein